MRARPKTVKSIRQQIQALSKQLRPMVGERSLHEARLLLGRILRMSEVELIQNDTKDLDESQLNACLDLVQKRLKGKPISQILGYKEFFGHEFKVSEQVLTPRPETEGLVQGVIEWCDKRNISHPSILDLGTGSGCIAISLAKAFFQKASVVAVDLSEQALLVAKENAQLLGSNQIEFYQLDIHEEMNFSAPFDVIVSNPPYVPLEDYDHLPKDIRDFEPHMAIVGGEEGMQFYQSIFDLHWRNLKPRGLLALETYDQRQRQALELRLKSLNTKRSWIQDCHLFVEKES